MNPLSIAVAGVGMIGRRHVDLVQRSKECRLAAIVDPPLLPRRAGIVGRVLAADPVATLHLASLGAEIGAAAGAPSLFAEQRVELFGGVDAPSAGGADETWHERIVAG